MVKINKTGEPDCLTELKENPANKYNNLQGDCLKIVRNQLLENQKHLCAYCQRKFESSVFIEHYFPQADVPEKQLDYDNFLGVCSGQYYLDRKLGKAIRFCSVERGNLELTINPETQTHIDTLFYGADNRIQSTNTIFQKELDLILNLNFDDLCIDRGIVLEEEEEIIYEYAIEFELSPIEAYQQAINSVHQRNPEFSGLLLYRFNQLIEYHSA